MCALCEFAYPHELLISENKINEEIYFNDGNGYFDNNNLLGLPDSSGMLTIRDIDSDGKLDIIKTDAYTRHFLSDDITEKRTVIYFKDSL